MPDQTDDIPPPTTTIEPVFLLAGQSNMAGRCTEEDLPTTTINPDIDINFRFNNDSNFGDAVVGGWGPLQCQGPSPAIGKKLFGPEFGLA